ncbi:MAG: sulfatase-like hydrolase/transferase, partial [Verrucomicrobiota bacterium]
FEHMDRVGAPDLWRNNEAIQRDGYTTELITEDAMTFLDRAANQRVPFFLYLSHPAPHFPWQGPNDAEKEVRPKKASWQQGDRETYRSMVESMDEGIGKVLTKLDQLGLRNSTLLVFSSDNGGHTHSRNAPLRDFKGTRWEGGVRVPCIARWPGVIPAGQVTMQVGITMDWTTTFRKLAALPIDPAGEDGMDLLPSLKAPSEIRERTLFWKRAPSERRKRVREGRAVRQGSWKYISYADGDRHLFDLAQDPSEEHDLFSEMPEHANQLQAAIDEWEQTVSASPF